MTDTAGQNELVSRTRAILTTPKAEWPVIADESATMADIYMKYVLILAAIPVAASFISNSILGVAIPFGGAFRFSIVMGLSHASATYVLSLVGVFVIALVTDALAPTFGGTKNQIQALKAVAYASTGFWVASIAAILPLIGWLIVLGGGIYSLYLLYLGLPVTMKSPADRALPYTAAVIGCAIVVWIIIVAIVRVTVGGPGIMGPGMMGWRMMVDAGSSTGTEIQFASGSPLGWLEAGEDRMEQANNEVEEARQSRNSDA